MGLVKALSGAAMTTLADQWKEFIYCSALGKEVLMRKGEAYVAPESSNTSRSANIVTNGSKIVVNEGQALLVVENGKIIDFSVEPGAYIWHSGTEPSLFDGGWQGLKDSFKTFGRRFTYGGQPENDLRVYFVNTTEIINNKFGVGDVPFRDGEFGFSVMLRGYGVYSFCIFDPILFYTTLAANVEDVYMRSQLEEQLRNEVQHCMLPALGRLAQRNIAYDKIPLYTRELAEELDQELSEKWARLGLDVLTVSFASITPSEESMRKIAQFQEARMYKDPALLGGRLGAAQAQAMQDAAKNAQGALPGFIGMGLAQQAGGVNVSQLFQMASKQDVPVWKCTCGTVNSGHFCGECGKKKPEPANACTHEHAGPGAKFCPDCGAALKQ